MIKVSIITATYNSESFILDTIKSINNQNYENIEWIIIDNNSSDETISLIEENSTIEETIIISEQDNGIYYALNKGIKKSKGDIVGFLHSDDIFYNDNTVTTIVNQFNKNKIDFLYGNLNYIKSNYEIVRTWKSTNFTKKKLYYGWMPPHPTLFLKKQIYDSIGYFNVDYRISSDYDFILRLFKSNNFKFKHISKTITLMRVGGVSNGKMNDIIKKSTEDYQIIKKYKLYGIFTLICKNLRKVKQFF